MLHQLAIPVYELRVRTLKYSYVLYLYTQKEFQRWMVDDEHLSPVPGC